MTYHYKNAIIGIYQIKNLVSGKLYIGSSNIVQKRWTQHRRELRTGIHSNPRLQNAWNKYGEENFEFSIVEVCDIDNLRNREQHFINSLSPFYNIADVVGMPYTPKAGSVEAYERCMKGQPARTATLSTEECQERMSKAAKEVWTREGHREARSSETLELWNSAEYRMKQKVAHRKVDDRGRQIIQVLHREGYTKPDLAKEYNVSVGTIRRVILGLH